MVTFPVFVALIPLDHSNIELAIVVEIARGKRVIDAQVFNLQCTLLNPPFPNPK